MNAAYITDETVFAANVRERVIWLDGAIDTRLPRLLHRALKAMNRKKNGRGKEIFLYVSGPGGNFEATTDMMIQIGDSASPVVIVAYGKLESGCFLMTQASPHRAATRNAKFTFHRTLDNFVQPGPDEAVEITADEHIAFLKELLLLDSIQLQNFFRYGRPPRKIKKLFKTEATINFRQAKRLKLIKFGYSRKDLRTDFKKVKPVLRAHLKTLKSRRGLHSAQV